MAITTYSELKTAIGTWLARSDLTDYLADIITLAENRVHHGVKEGPFQSPALRCRDMETSADLTVSTRTAALPEGFLEAKRLYLNTSEGKFLDYVTPEFYWATHASSNAGEPDVFTIEGSDFVFGPVPDSTYTGKLLYLKKFTALSDANPSNALLTNAPNIYLYASLLEAQPFIQNDERLPLWHSLYLGAVSGLQDTDNRGRRPRTALVMRPIGTTP